MSPTVICACALANNDSGTSWQSGHDVSRSGRGDMIGSPRSFSFATRWWFSSWSWGAEAPVSQTWDHTV